MPFTFNLKIRAALHAAYWLGVELLRPRSCFRAQPVSGYQRGIEHYSNAELLKVAAISIAVYYTQHGRWPKLVDPVTQTEKLLWMKFFGYLPMPSPANKLAVAELIPSEFADRLRVPDILWRSKELCLPPPDAIPRGHHFIKVNNGTGSNLRLDFPLSPEDRTRFKTWLAARRSPSGLRRGGEWWYATIEPEIFIERAVANTDQLEEWSFFVFNGGCIYLVELQEDEAGAIACTMYDREFTHIPVRVRHFPIGRVRDDLREFTFMRQAAEAIAAKMSLARVDFYRTKSGDVRLGEITLCSMNTKSYYSDPEFDGQLGERWNHRFLY